MESLHAGPSTTDSFDMGIIPGELIMYDKILKIIEINADKITRNILEQIHSKPETLYYSSVTNEYISVRIFHVIRDVNKKLSKWLNKNEPRNILFTSYSELGAMRCRQCVPLEALTAVFLMIRKEICHVISSQASSLSGLPSNMPEKISYCLNLLFAGIIQSIVTGYNNELNTIISTVQSPSNCSDDIQMKQYSNSVNGNSAAG